MAPVVFVPFATIGKAEAPPVDVVAVHVADVAAFLLLVARVRR